jgi:hypothetical protein
MQALCENKVRSMCRCRGARPERWLVPPEFWNDHDIFSTSDGVEVTARSSGAEPFGRFFCWQPDLERMVGDETKLKRLPSRSTAEGQARQGAPLKYDWFAIVTEVAFREANATKKERGRSDHAEAISIRRWCVKQLKQRPALSELREVVKIVRRRFRGPE